MIPRHQNYIPRHLKHSVLVHKSKKMTKTE